MYKSDINKFNQTAKEWVQKFANPDNSKKEKVKKIMELGFSEA